MLRLFKFLLIIWLVRVLIKVLEVLIILEFRDPWRLDALLSNNAPVDSLEPTVRLQIFSSAAKAAEPF